MRSITLNAHYIVLMQNPRDTSQIQHLAKQMFSKNMNFLTESYEDATNEPFSYILLDMKQNTKEDMKILGNYEVKNSDGSITVYSPNKTR